MNLEERIRRDEAAAQTVHAVAKAALYEPRSSLGPVDPRSGPLKRSDNAKPGRPTGSVRSKASSNDLSRP